ncbi:MAG: RICIN domain-containing protein [Crocinitomicaceae bacterium]
MKKSTYQIPKKALLFITVMITLFSFSTQVNAQSASSLVGKYVKILNVHSGKALCTMHWSKDEKSRNNQEAIIQYSYSGDPTHIWLIKSAGNNMYILENAHSGKVLCTRHWSKDPKSTRDQEAIIQYGYSGDATHKWRINSLGNGQYQMLNGYSGKALCTMHWSKDAKSSNNQEAIIQYGYTGDPTHKWRMSVVNYDPNPPVAPTIEYTVKVDACHPALIGTGTESGITVEFLANGQSVGSSFSKVLAEGCNGVYSVFSLKTNKLVDKFVVRISGEDAAFIDKVTLSVDGKEVRYYGSDGGEGYCLSSSSSDASGDWQRYLIDGKCYSSVNYLYKR